MYDTDIIGAYFGKKPHQLSKITRGARIELLHRVLRVKMSFIPYNIYSNHWVYFKIDLTTDSLLLHHSLSLSGQTQSSQIRLLMHRLAQ